MTKKEEAGGEKGKGVGREGMTVSVDEMEEICPTGKSKTREE